MHCSCEICASERVDTVLAFQSCLDRAILLLHVQSLLFTSLVCICLFEVLGYSWHIALLSSRKLSFCCHSSPPLPFSTELAGFIKKVRSKSKNSLSGLIIDEIVQRVTERILDEQKKQKVSIASRYNETFHVILLYL